MQSLRWLSQDKGAQIAEFAAVVPMLVMVILGILWFGRAFSIYTTVNHATRAAAQAATLHGCVTCVDAAVDIENNVVNPIFIAAHLDPSQKSNYGIDHSSVTLPSGMQVSLYTAHMRYPYNFKLNGFTCCPPALTPVTLGVTITAQAQSKEEN